jgi:hypothetical protein
LPVVGVSYSPWTTSSIDGLDVEYRHTVTFADAGIGYKAGAWKWGWVYLEGGVSLLFNWKQEYVYDQGSWGIELGYSPGFQGGAGVTVVPSGNVALDLSVRGRWLAREIAAGDTGRNVDASGFSVSASLGILWGRTD